MASVSEVAQILPVAALIAALYGLWLNATREHVKAAADAKYAMGGRYRKLIRHGRVIAYAGPIVPLAVVLILLPLVIPEVRRLTSQGAYSPTNALFLLVFVLWIAGLALALWDIRRVERSASSARKAELADKNT